jgi:hypothetical protein
MNTHKFIVRQIVADFAGQKVLYLIEFTHFEQGKCDLKES